MTVSAGYLEFVLDQLRSVLPTVRARRMFGGQGVYAGDLFFAVLDDDMLYLKVDDATRGDYESRGMPAFQPMEGVASMNYSQLPEEMLEEPEALRPWVERAVEVAARAKAKRSAKGSAKRKPAKKSAKPVKRPAKKVPPKKTSKPPHKRR